MSYTIHIQDATGQKLKGVKLHGRTPTFISGSHLDRKQEGDKFRVVIHDSGQEEDTVVPQFTI